MAGFSKSFSAGSGGVIRYRCVKLSSGAVIACTADTDAVLGLAEDSADEGEAVAIRLNGVFKATAGEAITQGDRLMTGSAGKVFTHDGNTSEVFLGRALEAADADGDVIQIELFDHKPPSA